MSYFKNIQSLDDLKSQFRKLAMEHHPDAGGDVKIMQTINSEYDQLFVVWKRRSDVETNETAQSTRSEFYTQHGWKGENYNAKLTLKEIACIIREFIKIHYNDFKFSVTTDYGSMCQSLDIALMEGPCEAYKTFAELTVDEMNEVRRAYILENDIGSYTTAELDRKIETVFNKEYGGRYQTDRIKDAAGAVKEFADSFNWKDCDAMIDYFNVNFWFHGVKIGKYDRPYKVVARVKKEVPDVEYENVEVTKKRTKKVLEPQEIATPPHFEQGQLFRLKSSFNYGCVKGTVYQIDRISSGNCIHSYRLGKGYKNVCKGNIRGNTFTVKPEKLSAWVAQGAIAFIELVEVTRTEEYTSVVRRPKKQTGVSTNVAESLNKEFSITPDVDTRDNSPLWVVKFIERMEREDFQEVREQIKGLGGYYSRYKHGFIFTFDPTETLKEFSAAA